MKANVRPNRASRLGPLVVLVGLSTLTACGDGGGSDTAPPLSDGTPGSTSTTATVGTVSAMVSTAPGNATLNVSTSTWAPAAPLPTIRSYHSATLLPNGKVLVAGGREGSPTVRSVSLYDPATDTWSAAADMITTRNSHKATLLQNGQVLVTGGMTSSNISTASAEIYNPSTDSWSSAGNIPGGWRARHTATLLTNGKVLVAGGISCCLPPMDPIFSTALYDPATNSWTSAGNLASSRADAAAVLLSNVGPPATEYVLIIGGSESTQQRASAEIYDPVANTWAPAASMATARGAPVATLLANGNVFVTGGHQSALTEIYDPALNTWASAASMSNQRIAHTATLLTNGTVLVAGGQATTGYLDASEVYDPATNTWGLPATMTTSRALHTATLLPNGAVIVIGGYNGATLQSTDIY